MATASLPGGMRAKLEAIAGAGFSSVELYEPDFISWEGSAADLRSMADSLDLKIALLWHFYDPEGQAGLVRVFDRLEAKFDTMQAIGTDTLMLSSTARMTGTGVAEQIADDLAEAAERARKRGLRLAYLALPGIAGLTSELMAAELIRKINSPALGLALNSRFSLAGDRRPSDLRELEGTQIFHVQLSDAPGIKADTRMHHRHFGLLPGQGRLNLSGFVRMLARLGYKGAWSIARLSEQMRERSAHQVAGDAFRALVTLLDEAARTEPALEPSGLSLPPRIAATGFEFIEFAVDAKTREPLTQALSSMCFRRERRHISKAVELWRQGAVNIVVNSDSSGFARTAFLSHGPSVCDMGLRVGDARATVERARILGTEPFAQSLGTGELDIPAIKGVGGSVVHFIDEKSDLHRVWDIEFEPVRKTPATPPAGLRRVDHVAQTMPFDEMQSWLLYYITTFEMNKSEIINVADPSGVVRSQAVESPEGAVRLNLNGASGQQTLAGSFLADQLGAGVQHIAFLSDDIFETSTALEAAGFERLKIPANYYVDLEARTDLDKETIAAMKAGHILYERSGRGEYFQIYSQPLFTGFFFEIVARRMGYAGYGAANAPIRLAAQRRQMRLKESA